MLNAKSASCELRRRPECWCMPLAATRCATDAYYWLSGVFPRPAFNPMQ